MDTTKASNEARPKTHLDKTFRFDVNLSDYCYQVNWSELVAKDKDGKQTTGNNSDDTFINSKLHAAEGTMEGNFKVDWPETELNKNK